MIHPSRHKVIRVLWTLLGMLLGGLLSGCGLLMDAAKLVEPILPSMPDDIALICRHGYLRVGIANEPAPPFVLLLQNPGQEPKVSGLDIELLHRVTDAISRECHRPVVAALTVLPFKDLFIELTEGHLDLFVSAMAANVPHLIATGIGYSNPYFSDTGIIGLTADPTIAESVRKTFRRLETPDVLDARRAAFHGLTVAVQEERSPYLYAAARLTGARLMVCDTLAAAMTNKPQPDVVLGKQAILEFAETREPSGWQPLALENHQPLVLAREYYSIAMAENNYRLRWLVNDVIFDLEQSGRLKDLHRRWRDPAYSESEAAFQNGMPCPECRATWLKSPGGCRTTAAP